MIDFEKYQQPNTVYIGILETRKLSLVEQNLLKKQTAKNSQFLFISEGQSLDNLPLNITSITFKNSLLETFNRVAYLLAGHAIQLMEETNNELLFNKVSETFFDAVKTFQFIQRSLQYRDYADSALLNSYH